MVEKNNNPIPAEIANNSTEVDYFEENSSLIKNLLRRYHNVVLVERAIVKSDPVFLQSKKTKNRFAKFTIELDSPLPWEKKRELPPEKRGDVFVDCLAFENKKNMPGAFVLENIRKGALISGVAIMKSGRKPVKHEGDEYRANWVYGDYIYLSIHGVKIDCEPPAEKPVSPYKKDVRFSPYYQKTSEKQTVTDEDIIFNI